MQLVMDADRLDVSLEGLEHLWAVRLRSISIPLAHVTGAEASMPSTSWREIRAPGTAVPGLIKAGTYYTPRGREFWYVARSRTRRPLTIELSGEPFKRLVIGIEDAQGWAERINAAVRR